MPVPGQSEELWGSAALETALRRFESFWQNGRVPAIQDFLPVDDVPADKVAARRRIQWLMELILFDLDYRWRLSLEQPGDTLQVVQQDDSRPLNFRVEDYLALFPEIGVDDEHLLNLVIAEYQTRLKCGDVPQPDSYLPRFGDRLPQLGDRLRATSHESGILDSSLYASETQASMPIDSAEMTLRESDQPLADAKPRPPQKFGRYRILKRIGHGAMEDVYLAHDTQLEREVALKTPRMSGLSTEIRHRFLREARAAAKLRHQNICPVYDVGEVDGQLFLTMHWVCGMTLLDRIRSGESMGVPWIATVIRSIALAMHEAHRQGVVHRDLKPSNIMLSEDGEPIVMDFGLAHHKYADGDERLTRSGVIIGSPAYMAPEQAAARNGEVLPVSDVYSLGVVLYEILTGQLPYSGSWMHVITERIQHDPPPPSARSQEVDRRLENICLRMMYRDPDKRFQSMKKVVRAIDKSGLLASPTLMCHVPALHPDEAGDDGTDSDTVDLESGSRDVTSNHENDRIVSSANPVSVPVDDTGNAASLTAGSAAAAGGQRRRLTVIGIVAGLVSTVLVLTLLPQLRQQWLGDGSVTIHDQTPGDETTITPDKGPPDIPGSNGNSTGVASPVESWRPHPIVPGLPIVASDIAADGRVITTSLDGTIGVWSVDGQVRRFGEKSDDMQINDVRWAPAGELVALVQGIHLEVRDIDNWEVQHKAHLDESTMVRDLEWSPDGRQLVVVSSDPDEPCAIWNLESGDVETLPLTGEGFRNAAWSPDERVIALGLFDPSGQDLLGDGVYLWDVAQRGLQPASSGSVYSGGELNWLLDNRRLIWQENDKVYEWDISVASTPRIIDQMTESRTSIAVKPDGRQFVALAAAGADASQLVMRRSESGEYKVAATGLAAGMQQVQWSPDGRYRVVVGKAGLLYLLDGKTLQIIWTGIAFADHPHAVIRANGELNAAASDFTDSLRFQVESDDGTWQNMTPQQFVDRMQVAQGR